MSEQKQPLWKVIDEAWWSLVDTNDPTCAPPGCDQAACVIRAVRDWILAELETAEGEGWIQSNLIELPDLEAMLTTEADRAERGDQTTSQEH